MYQVVPTEGGRVKVTEIVDFPVSVQKKKQ